MTYRRLRNDLYCMLREFGFVAFAIWMIETH